MVKIAYLLLCHRDVEGVATQARALAAAGDVVAIHFDKRAGADLFRKLKDALNDAPSVTFARRVACGWGEYSLVQAALNAIEAAREAFDGVTHYYLISADCMPTKSAAFLKRSLADGDRDYIEINDFLDSGWIKTGLKEDRLIYRHYFNERERKTLFYGALELQRRLGLERKLPDGIRVKIGSQWWLLRAATVDRMLAYMRRRADVVRFFRTTWIPDETMFQTIAFHCAPRGEIVSRPPTTLMFSDYGIPVVFCADHQEMLAKENRFFARKITTHDPAFRQRLLDHYVHGAEDDEEGDESLAAYYGYLARRGRDGRRQAPRFWQRAITLDDDNDLLIVACKKWHVGQRLAETAARICGLDAFGYVFDDDEPIDAELGGLEVGRDKRGRHRRAFLNLLYVDRGAKRLAICVDPSRLDVVNDFAAAGRRTRVLLIETGFSDDDYLGHAERVGLITSSATSGQRAAVVDALRVEFEEEAAALRRAQPARLVRMSASQGRIDNAAAIARFFGATRDEVEAIVREMEPHL